MKKVMKKIVSFVLLIGLVLTSMYVSTPEMGEVKAAAVTTDTDGNYVKSYADVTTYRKAEAVEGSDEEQYVFTAPTLTVDDGDDYADYIFAGWFTDNTCVTPLGKTDVTTASACAKFVPRDTLSVKFQTANGTVKDEEYDKADVPSAIRFISSVDSLDYQSVGFEVSNKATTYEPFDTSEVYEKIDSTMSVLKNGQYEQKEYSFSPKVVGTESEYFFTVKMAVSSETDETDYKVTAYWVTLDGTKVYGDTRYVNLQDGSSTKNILNLTVDGVLTIENSETYTAKLTTYATADGETFEETFPVEVLYQGTDYTNIRIDMDSVDLDDVEGADVTLNDLTSATKVAIVGNENVTGVYRRYDTSHESTTLSSNGTTYVANKDTSWYYINPDATHFIIASSADLYGFDYIADNVTNFSRDTVTLVRDVEINKGQAVRATLNEARTTVASDAEWKPDEGENGNQERIYDWNPIASSSNSFNGTFDGDNNTISGLYQNVTTNYNGLFAVTGTSSVLRNISLKNSYIKANADYLGGMVGLAYSQTLENLYCDAVLVLGGSGKAICGGLVGRLRDSNQHYVDTCWFAGQILIKDTAFVAGGLLGQTNNSAQKIKMDNCLNSGEIICESKATGLYLGGILGAMAVAINSGDRGISNCIDVGSISVIENTTAGVGAFFGNVHNNSTAPVTHSYTLCDLYVAGTQSSVIYNGSNAEFDKIAKKTLDELCQIVETDLVDSYVVKDGKIVLKYFAQ